MSTTPSTHTSQWQDNGFDTKERKPPLPHPSELARALSPTGTRKNHTNNVQEPSVRNNTLSPPRTRPQASPQQRGNIDVTRSRANHNDKSNPAGKSFSSKMEFLDTLLHEIDENDPRNVVTPMLPSQIRKMAAKNQPPPIIMPGSPLKKSPSAPVLEMQTYANSKPLPPPLSLEAPLPQSPDRKQPPPSRPSRHHTDQDKSPLPDQAARFHRAHHTLDQPARDQPAHDQPARDQPARDQPARDQPARDQPARDQPARDQPARDQPARDQRSAFIGKPDSPDQARPSAARQNALAGGSRAMLAHSRIPHAQPPPPPPSILPPPPAPPDLPPPLSFPFPLSLPPVDSLSPPEEPISPRHAVRPGFVAVLPMSPPITLTSAEDSNQVQFSPQKLLPPPTLQDIEPPLAQNDKKTFRKSPNPDWGVTPSQLTETDHSLFPRLPPPPPPHLVIPSLPSSNLTNVYSALPPPPPLPEGDGPKLRTSTSDDLRKEDTIRRSKELEMDGNTHHEEGFKFAKGRSSLGKASQIQISTTRTTNPNPTPLSTSAELAHSHSAPLLLQHDVSSSPISFASVLSPLSHSGSMSPPPAVSSSAPPSPPPSSSSTPTPSSTPNPSDPSDLTYEQRMRKKLISEIVLTEIDYVKDLELTIEVYLHPLRASHMLNEEQLHTIFSDVEILLNFNKILKAELEKQHSLVDISAMKIGSAFLTMSPFLKLYSAYCSNQPIAFKALEDYKKANPNFAKFLADTAYDPRCKGLFLSSYLIKPVQRVCKYPLFLRDLLKYTPKDHVDYAGLVEAETMINSVVQAINEYKRALEAYHAVVELANIMEGCDDLVQPTRKFVAEGDVMCCFDFQGMQKPRRLHLFNDILLICKKKRRVGWKVKDRVNLSAARLISLAVDSLEFGLEISCENSEKFILVFPNDVQWTKWSKLLKDQILQNRVASHTRRGLLQIAEQNSVSNLKAK